MSALIGILPVLKEWKQTYAVYMACRSFPSALFQSARRTFVVFVNCWFVLFNCHQHLYGGRRSRARSVFMLVFCFHVAVLRVVLVQRVKSTDGPSFCLKFLIQSTNRNVLLLLSYAGLSGTACNVAHQLEPCDLLAACNQLIQYKSQFWNCVQYRILSLIHDA